MSQGASGDQTIFTCLSCSIAFFSAEEQRLHYRSDHHRYNMKRRVASLPPVSALVFNQKVVERKAETAVMSSSKDSSCEVCNKSYTTENAYRSHIQSKKHKENELKAAEAQIHSQILPAAGPSLDTPDAAAIQSPAPTLEAPVQFPAPTLSVAVGSLNIDDSTSVDDIEQSIDEKIAAARARLSQKHCLFCPEELSSFEDNLTHMSLVHSFFIPDADYLIDVQGLITYLGEKIAVGNVCIFCNGKGKEFRTLEAVRKHMVDKSHCKIAYESGDERLEISDFYDFTTSYPDLERIEKKRKSRQNSAKDNSAEEWEDVDDEVDNEEVDEVIEGEFSEDSELDSDDGSSSEESLPDNQITYGDSEFELVLPSGARIGHRTMRRYYAQTFPRVLQGDEDPGSGAALVRRLLADKNSALVPVRGGFGAFGKGTEVVKARNRGEAREAGRHVREFRDQKRREDFKTKVGFIHNSQKHFRDPLLQ